MKPISFRLPFLLLSLVSLATANGCAPEVLNCTTEARASVRVVAADSSGAAVQGTAVSFSLDDGATFQPCDDISEGRWVCGWEVEGDILVRAEAAGYVPVERAITVDSDECHVIGESVTLSLDEQPASSLWEEPRAYYVQLIEDPDDCANSWELFSMNCYQTAEFCPDGSVQVVVTDIINGGLYGLTDETVQVQFDSPGDLPVLWDLEVQGDGNLRDGSGAVWIRDAEFEVVWEPACDQG